MSEEKKKNHEEILVGTIRPCNGKMYLDTNGEFEQVLTNYDALDKVVVTVQPIEERVKEVSAKKEAAQIKKDDGITICQEALLAFGNEAQIDMLSEEVGELLSAINKYRRGRCAKKDVVTEIADVEIMLKQMELIFGWDEVIEERQYKLNRLKERLDSYKDHAIG